MSAGFSFPNQARALLGTVCFGSEPTLGATSCFRTSCFNLFLASHHLLRLLPPPGIRAGSPCCPQAVHFHWQQLLPLQVPLPILPAPKTKSLPLPLHFLPLELNDERAAHQQSEHQH